MVWVAAAFVAGLGAASVGIFPGWIAPFALLVAAVLVAWKLPSGFANRASSVSMAAFAVGALLWNAQHTDAIGDALSRYVVENPQKDTWTVEGEVRLSDLEDSQPGQRQFVLDVDTVRVGGKTLALRGATMVSQFRSTGVIYATQRLRVTGRITTTIGRVNPNVSGYEGYVRSKGIHTALDAEAPDAIEVLSPGRTWSVAYWASWLRRVQAERMVRSLQSVLAVPESPLGFVNAIWLGYRSQMSAAENQTYIESGTFHILSVSGIHMAMVYWTAFMLAGIGRKSRQKQSVLAIVALVLFTLMSGLRPSALRSAIMIGVYLISEPLGRERDASNALALSAVVLLGWNTDWLFDTGFQLSFLSVASMLLFTEPIDALIGRLIKRIEGPRMPAGITRYRMSKIRKWFRRLRTQPQPGIMGYIWRWPRGLVAASIAVQILPLPLAMGAFHILPLGSLVANFFVIPLSAFALWLCLATQIAGLVSDYLSQVFGSALVPVVECIRFVAAHVAKSWPHLTLTSPTILAMACYWCAALLWAAHLEKMAHLDKEREALSEMETHIEKPSHWKRRLAPAVVLLSICVACWNPWHLEPMVAFLDVGHGDAAFIRSNEGRTMLVDGGDRSGDWDMGRTTVAPFLWSNYVKHLDCIALSHPDRDHIGGLSYILERFDVGMVILGANPTGRQLENDLLSICEARDVPVRRVHIGEKIVLDSMEAEVLSPPDNATGEDVNNQSLVLRVRWSGIRILLVGDIESPAEARLARNDCAADVLKVPHHGSKTSSSIALLQAVHPSICVISTGGEHGREHVDDGVLDVYRRRDIPMWRTDWYGGIALHVRDGAVQVSGERIERGYPCPAPPVDSPDRPYRDP